MESINNDYCKAKKRKTSELNKKPIFLITKEKRCTINTFLYPVINELQEGHELKLLKNRESALKSRKKKKVIFEKLKSDLANLTQQRSYAKVELDNKINSLQKTYEESEALKQSADKVMEENKRLKDGIINLQNLIKESKHQIYIERTLNAYKLFGKTIFPINEVGIIQQNMQGNDPYFIQA